MQPEGGLPPGPPAIARGMGRCYGDASLAEQVLATQRLNRILDFEADTGVVYCEAGLTFADLIAVFLPHGWFPPVTPGTKYVSLGGALAANVHGKNHHCEGAISRYVQEIELRLADGRLLRCSRQQHASIFWATLGGMGLTGVILRLSLQLKRVSSSWMHTQSIRARNLEEILHQLEAFETDTYSVAWLDCLASGRRMGRSILLKGEHAEAGELPARLKSRALKLHPPRPSLNVPFYFPSFVLNPFSIRLFNAAYYHRLLRKEQHRLSHYDTFFYPLDAVHHWNRIYGRRGFVQYQFVIPKAAGAAGLKDLLTYIQAQGRPSFLSVLKLLGPGEGLMAFPMQGYTLALDFALHRELFAFLDELDERVLHYGGRVYLAKDARMSPQSLRRMYPGLPEFQALLQKLDPEKRLCSHLAKRLQIR